jgi:uncharacterized membrane protein YraQ (UPF0718 family)
MGDVMIAFLSIVFEGAPYILLGTILSGLIDAFLPARLLEKVLPRNAVVSTLLAGLLGLVFPVCECAIVPVIRRLLKKGLPLSCAMTYMLAAPIVNPVVMLSTSKAFGNLSPDRLTFIHDFHMMFSRASLGYVVAVLAGLVVLCFKASSLLQPGIVDGSKAVHEHGQSRSFDGRLVQAMRTAMRDFLDTGMYFVIGVCITAVFNTQVNQVFMDQIAASPVFAVPGLMTLAVVLSLCSTSDAFIAAPMTSFSFAAKLAFLVFGPMMDIKLLFMYSAVFRRKVVAAMFVGLFLVIAILAEPWTKLTKDALTREAPAAPAASAPAQP